LDSLFNPRYYRRYRPKARIDPRLGIAKGNIIRGRSLEIVPMSRNIRQRTRKTVNQIDLRLGENEMKIPNEGA
jgi:hypothetical protein